MPEANYHLQRGTVLSSCAGPVSSVFSIALVDVASVLARQLPNGKARGEDCAPNELLEAHPGRAARLSWPLMGKAIVRVQEPSRWKGGVWVEVRKGPGVRAARSSHRGVLASVVVGAMLMKCICVRVQGNMRTCLLEGWSAQ